MAQETRVKNFSGGDFSQYSNNRFMLRRGRIRFDYIHFSDTSWASIQFVFQFDGTERGVLIKDFWGRIFENKNYNYLLSQQGCLHGLLVMS